MNEFNERDLFAAFAMNGMIHHFDFHTFADDPKRLSKWAYDAADAMMVEKEERDAAASD